MKNINFKNLAHKLGSSIVMIQPDEPYSFDYYSFVSIMSKFPFTELSLHDVHSKHSILKNCSYNKGKYPNYGVLINLSNVVLDNITYTPLNKLKPGHYAIGSFLGIEQKCSNVIRVKFSDFIKACEELYSKHTDNNLEKEPIYLTYQIKKL